LGFYRSPPHTNKPTISCIIDNPIYFAPNSLFRTDTQVGLRRLYSILGRVGMVAMWEPVPPSIAGHWALPGWADPVRVHFVLRLTIPADFLCLIHDFVCLYFPTECKMTSFWCFHRNSCSKTCPYRSLWFEDLRPRQATGQGRRGTPQPLIAGRGTA
jgi:hypothetical protein